MVAIFTGLAAGRSSGSAATLGAAGLLGSATQGRGGDQVTLNAATGNLVLSRQDEFLIGRGPDLAIARTYNSLAQAADDNGDQWRQSTDRRVFGLEGTANAAGSTVRRVAGDGAVATYVWQGSYYETTDGGGSHDRLNYAGGYWTWTDGDTQVAERYAAHGAEWRIDRQTDSDGNRLTFTYTGDTLTRIATADGGTVDYGWTGGNITSIVTGYKDDAGVARTLTRTRYFYDASNRLSQVTTDLSPEDNSIADGRIYATGYEYANATTRLVSAIVQSDGSRLNLTYDAAGRVVRIAQVIPGMATRTTGIAYGTNATDVTDPMGRVTTLRYDAAGQLTAIETPAVQAYPAATVPQRQTVAFAYDADGNLAGVTDASGARTGYVYDARGNVTKITDANGDTTERWYDANDSLVRERTYGRSGGGAADAAIVTQYIHNDKNQLRYTMSGEGHITEYRYDGYGNPTTVIEYSSNAITPVFGLLTEADLDAWRSGIPDSTPRKTTANAYDARGNVTRSTDGGYVSAIYTYDQHGQLLSRATPGEAAESFLYDGLGRLVSTTNTDGGATSIVFDDPNTTTVVTTASGLSTTSTYNKDGDLVSSTEAGYHVAGGTARYDYDADGRVTKATDATGYTSYYYYDEAGRKVADIDHYGHVVEYRHDANGRVIATVRYANGLAGSNFANRAVFRPARDDAADLWQWTAYDSGGRVGRTVAGDGSVTGYEYDGAGRLVATTAYATKISVTSLGRLRDGVPGATTTVAANPEADSRLRSFYDRDGRLTGTLNAEGHLSQILYDEAGRTIQEIAYTAPTAAALRADGTFVQLRASTNLAPDAQLVTRTVRDGAGRVRYVVADDLRVTEYGYDAAGRQTQTIQYATPIAAAATFSLDAVQAAVATANPLPDATIRRSFVVYNGQGHAAYAIDASGGVTGFTYDTAGRVVRTARFATAYSPGGLPRLSTMDGWAATKLADARITRTFYSARGDEVRFEVDPENFVTRHDYDAEGRLVRDYRWANTVTATDASTTSDMNAASQAAGTWAGNRYGYDAVGRLTDAYQVYPDGVAEVVLAHSSKGYYGNGTLQWEIQGAGLGAAESRTLSEYDLTGRLVRRHDAYGVVGQQATTGYGYDALGNLASITDANGNTTRFANDRLGRALTRTDALGGVTRYEYDALGNTVKTTDARGGETFRYYDSLNRLTLSVDPEGYGTRTAYTAFDEVASVTRYVQPLAATPVVATPPAFAPSGGYATTGFAYDKLGRVVGTTDALGNTDGYTLDAFGQRVAVRNKLGAVTTNVFDKRGLLVEERKPLLVYDDGGTRRATSVTNRFEYDARGNRTKSIEAAGLTEQRVTTYAYDAADRLVETRGEPVWTYPAGDAAPVFVAPTESHAYDARGNVIETRDAVGARTLFYYDKLDRLTHQVSATGTLTQHLHDANGNVIETRVFETPVRLPAGAGGVAPASIGPYRYTQFLYDGNDRLVQTRVPGIRTGSFNGQFSDAVQLLTTNYAYDATGNVVRVQDPRGGATHSYYDRLGRKTSEAVSIDAATSQRTDWTYDAEGNVTNERRYAERAGVPALGGPPAVAMNAADRVTDFAYDKNGNRLTETRRNVLVLEPGAGTEIVRSAVISYQYNALGQVTRKIEATREGTDYAYDTSGRLVSETRALYGANGEAQALYQDYNGLAVSPRTTYLYNGLNDLEVTTQSGTTGAAARQTTYRYGVGGRLATVTDASGFARSYSYDAAGRVTRESYGRLTPGGSTVGDAIGYAYDLEGRVTTQGLMINRDGRWQLGSDPTLGPAPDVTRVEYNAFGEVSRRGVNGLQERFDHDDAGRVWRTNSGDGTWQYYMHDANGNPSLAVRSTGADLADKTLDDVLALFGGAANVRYAKADGAVATLTSYDQRDQATLVREPGRELAAGGNAVLTTRRAYTAFGEVASETDATGATVAYAYNTMGRLIETKSPLVATVLADGTRRDVEPTERLHYDAGGRLVASRDANGNLTRRALLAGTGYGGTAALVARTTFADGGEVSTGYDIHGDARTVTDQLGRVTANGYDRMGRLVRVAHADGLVDSYVLDGLGQRIEHTVLGVADGERTLFDAQGRVTWHRDMGGDTTTTAYEWVGTLTTAGMGRFGGWRTVATQANGRRTTVDADLYGRELSAYDLGGARTVTTYDAGGRVASEARGGVTTRHDQLNTGWLGGVERSEGAAVTRTATYGYDAAGRKVSERMDGPGGRLQSASATYDALGRMVSWSEAGNATTPRAAATYGYDAGGNVRVVGTTSYAWLDGAGRAVAYAAPVARERWFGYDAMDRVVVEVGGGSDTTTAYDRAGQRVSATTTQRRSERVWVEDTGGPGGPYTPRLPMAAMAAPGVAAPGMADAGIDAVSDAGVDPAAPDPGADAVEALAADGGAADGASDGASGEGAAEGALFDPPAPVTATVPAPVPATVPVPVPPAWPGPGADGAPVADGAGADGAPIADGTDAVAARSTLLMEPRLPDDPANPDDPWDPVLPTPTPTPTPRGATTRR